MIILSRKLAFLGSYSQAISRCYKYDHYRLAAIERCHDREPVDVGAWLLDCVILLEHFAVILVNIIQLPIFLIAIYLVEVRMLPLDVVSFTINQMAKVVEIGNEHKNIIVPQRFTEDHFGINLFAVDGIGGRILLAALV